MPALAYRFVARFAALDLEVESWEVDRSRTLIVHLPARGRGAQLSDRDRVPRRDTLVVRPTGDAATVTAKRDALIALQESGEARPLRHPIDGEWLARLSDFAEQVDAGGVTFRLTLTEDRQAQRRLAEVQQSETGSAAKVEAAAAIYEARRVELVAVEPDLALPIGGELVEATAAWDDVPLEQIDLDREAIRGDTDRALGSLEALLSPEAHETALALLALRAEIERYASARQRYAQRLSDIEVPFDRPLIAVLADLYGARGANRLIEDVIRSNSITDPARIRAGTVLRLPPR